MDRIIKDDFTYVSPSTGDGYVSVQAGHCYLYKMIVINLTDSTRYAQVWDTLTGPGGSAKLVAVCQVDGNSMAEINKPLPLFRWLLQNGLFVVSSTTAATYTAGGSSDLLLQVFYSQ